MFSAPLRLPSLCVIIAAKTCGEVCCRVAEDRTLSERERQVLRLVATGASNKEIAHQLVISANTVKVHLRNIFAKTGVISRTELTVYAIREGLVQVGEARLETPEETEEDLPEPALPEPPPAPPGTWRQRLGARRIAALVAAIIVFVAALATAGALAVGPLVSPPTPTPAVVAAAAPNRWRARAPMPTARAGLAAAAYDGRIYAIAGEGAEGPTGATERYDPAADIWTALAAKPVQVADVSGAVVGGRIFVPGGRLASGAVTSTVEAYDPVQDAWASRAPLPVALSAYAMVAFEGRLYVFGGWDGASFVATTYEYDPSRDTWTPRAPMPTARGFAGAAVAGGKIYVVGGTGDGTAMLTVNEEYTVSQEGSAAGPWAERRSAVEARSQAGVSSVADILHVVGGEPEAGSGVNLKYFARQDEWQSFETPVGSQPSVRPAVLSLETLLYVLGGDTAGAASDRNLSYQAIYTVLVPSLQ